MKIAGVDLFLQALNWIARLRLAVIDGRTFEIIIGASNPGEAKECERNQPLGHHFLAAAVEWKYPLSKRGSGPNRFMGNAISTTH
jgi:hypothetical protein